MNKTQYNTIHQWMLRHHKKKGSCSSCNRSDIKTHWANKSGQYIKEIYDWLELCPKCHHTYDIDRHTNVGEYQAKKTHCPKGHEYTLENTYTNPNFGSPNRTCKKCKADSQRQKRRERRERKLTNSIR